METQTPCPWLDLFGIPNPLFLPGGAQGHVAARLNEVRKQGAFDQLPVFAWSTDSLGALAYESRVGMGSVPTRDVAHDWYNGVVWLQCPQSKMFINQAHLSQAHGGLRSGANGRTRQRDALTLMDESGALLLTTNAARACALLNHDWSVLFANGEPGWIQDTRVLLFGHGLLEAMHTPHKGLCAKVLPVLVGDLSLAIQQWDALQWAALKHLEHPAQLSPLPVMGVPGWFAESKYPSFYCDTKVFRAKPTACGNSSPERLAFVWDGTTLQPGKCAGQSLLVLQGEESPDSSEHSAG